MGTIGAIGGALVFGGVLADGSKGRVVVFVPVGWLAMSKPMSR